MVSPELEYRYFFQKLIVRHLRGTQSILPIKTLPEMGFTFLSELTKGKVSETVRIYLFFYYQIYLDVFCISKHF